jgi:hypothetical protein
MVNSTRISIQLTSSYPPVLSDAELEQNLGMAGGGRRGREPLAEQQKKGQFGLFQLNEVKAKGFVGSGGSKEMLFIVHVLDLFTPARQLQGQSM